MSQSLADYRYHKSILHQGTPVPVIPELMSAKLKDQWQSVALWTSRWSRLIDGPNVLSAMVSSKESGLMIR